VVAGVVTRVVIDHDRNEAFVADDWRGERRMAPDILNANATPLARLMDMRVTDASTGGVTVAMTVRDDLCTVGGICHGGALMALADNAGAIATFLNLPADAGGTTTIESKTNLMAAAKAGDRLTARAEPLHIGRQTQVWQTRVTRGDGKLVSVTTQTQMVLSAS
jgi:uncharacterized protein (TIGR00369 family)